MKRLLSSLLAICLLAGLDGCARLTFQYKRKPDAECFHFASGVLLISNHIFQWLGSIYGICRMSIRQA